MNQALRYQRDFYPFYMNGCVLYLPFYRYGANQSKIWDLSGNNNHGTITGAIPAQIPIASGKELVTNGAFGSDTDWTKGTGWTISGGVANAAAGVASDLEQNVGVSAGKTYRLVYKLTVTAGSITPQLGGVNGVARSVDEAYEDIITTTGVGNLKFQKDAAFAGTVDDVSVQEVVGYRGLGWQFDGVDDFVNCGNSSNLSPTSAITGIIWTYFQEPYQYNVSNSTATFFSKHYLQYEFLLYVGKITVFIGDASNYDLYSSDLIPDPNFKWCCFAFSFDNQNMKIYMNGTLRTTQAKQTYFLVQTLNNLEIGRRSGGTREAKQVVGEVLIFDRILSAQEIKNYYELKRHIYGV